MLALHIDGLDDMISHDLRTEIVMAIEDRKPCDILRY